MLFTLFTCWYPPLFQVGLKLTQDRLASTDRYYSTSTVPFNSVRQSRVTGPSKSPKCHVGHGNFYKVPRSFCDLALNYRIFLPPAAQNCGKFPNVTVSLGRCRNQNFVRRVTRHMGCRSELNGTVIVNTSWHRHRTSPGEFYSGKSPSCYAHLLTPLFLSFGCRHHNRTMTMRQEEYVPPSFRAHAVLIGALRSPSRSQAVTGTPSVSLNLLLSSISFHLPRPLGNTSIAAEVSIFNSFDRLI